MTHAAIGARRTRTKMMYTLQATALAAGVLLLAGSELVHGQPTSALSQTPLFVSQALAPLNMLVMGRDHKLYYEAYNDASDLDNDGVIDVGYKPDKIDYYGYFNNNVCYSYDGADSVNGVTGVFKPVAAATGNKKKQCSGQWSGDFLNYLSTSRMDAIRRVLYGGTRVLDTKGDDKTAGRTVLQAAYIPRDAHTWGKSYDPVRDFTVYNIADYAPLQQPARGTRHLFAVTTLGEDATVIPHLRVLNDSRFQVWDWVSQQGNAGQNNCNGGGQCAQAAGNVYDVVPAASFRNLRITTYPLVGGVPGSKADMDTKFNAAVQKNQPCGTALISEINALGSDNNPFTNGSTCTQDNYITLITGEINLPTTGNYKFGIDGDDAVDVTLNGTSWGWYGSHAQNRANATFDAHSQSMFVSQPGWKSIVFRHVEGGGGDGWGLALQSQQPASAIADFNVRVEVCPSGNAALREASCKAYPNTGGLPIYKPTGLLHDFGETEKMYFGLLTGSYEKNIAGGTLRRNMSNFTEEVNAQTGQFKSTVQGVVYNIDHQRLIGYNGANYDGTGALSYGCGWITTSSISDLTDPSRCTMWGNPISEMMFEATRYFAGATDAHSKYSYASGSGTKDTKLGLSKPAWVSPYKPKSEGGGGYEHCAKPVMTVISDINPSYDGKVPGSHYGSISAEASDMSGFNAATETDAIGEAEGINGKKFFIGQSESTNADGAPSVKTVSALSRARGLSPQEPSKEGTYYSAGVARYAASNALFGNSKGKNKMMTYSVAIASPLPEIRFPVGGGRFITVAPFAKSVTGYSIDNTKFTPTNQIVDYYVDRIANTGDADKNDSINGGRPYAEFRINYEDVEQGADHDMDAIGRYVIALQEDAKTVKIDLVSEFASGGIGQHMGYVISGTTADGMYLEVRDKDTPSVFYAHNTPPGRGPGFCAKAGLTANERTECSTLGLTASRTFTPGTADSGSFLKGPLWYAAKYGIPDRKTADIKGDPDNYFLVTNATTLKDQMTKAFNSILQNTTSVTAASVSQTSSDLTNGASVYNTTFDAQYWSGDVIRRDTKDGVKSKKWSAAEQLAKVLPSARKIYYASKNASGVPELVNFTYAAISGRANDASWITALNINPTTLQADGQAAQRIDFIRGTIDNSIRERNKIDATTYNVLGDIVNSSLVRVRGAAYRPGAADLLEGTTKYQAFATAQAAKPEMLYVGSNDGMLHAFNATTGDEEFAFIPSSVKSTLNTLASANYGTSKGLAHRYYVDGTPVVTDVYFGGDWHKVLVGSMGAGGRQIFALDITDPTAPTLLWEFGVAESSDMGYSVPQPTIARLNNAGAVAGKWVVLLPNGYQGLSSTAGNANLFVLDISNGQIIRKFDLPGGMTTTELTASLPLGNGLSRVSAIDNDRDGKVDMAYAGDLAGNVWRFDLNSGTTSAWSAQLFFVARDKATAGARQPITSAPYVLKHPAGPGDLVIVGTGRFLSNADKESTQQQSVYGIWDRYSAKGATAPATSPTATKTRDDLHQQVFTGLANADPNKPSTNFKLTGDAVTWYKTGGGVTDNDVAKWGWYVDLPRAGEKIVYDMTLYGKSLLFSSVRTSEDPCKADIAGTIYAIDPNDGGKTDHPAFDINNDGKFDTSDQIEKSDVSGTEFDPGKITPAGGKAFTSGGNDSLGINSGVERGRQSWRRQPS